MKKIIEYSGGVVEQRRRRSVPEIRAMNKKGKEPVYFIITCDDDLYLVEDILKARQEVHNTEFIFSAVLKGYIDYDLSNSIMTT